jgi:iron-sulfur cluster assembly protein
MLTITDNAAEAVRQLATDSGLEPDPGLRISVGPRTADGSSLEIDLASSAGPRDETVEAGGARVYLDEMVAPALDDKVLDAELHGDHVHFMLRDAQPGSANGTAPEV